MHAIHDWISVDRAQPHLYLGPKAWLKHRPPLLCAPAGGTLKSDHVLGGYSQSRLHYA